MHARQGSSVASRRACFASASCRALSTRAASSLASASAARSAFFSAFTLLTLIASPLQRCNAKRSVVETQVVLVSALQWRAR